MTDKARQAWRLLLALLMVSALLLLACSGCNDKAGGGAEPTVAAGQGAGGASAAGAGSGGGGPGTAVGAGGDGAAMGGSGGDGPAADAGGDPGAMGDAGAMDEPVPADLVDPGDGPWEPVPPEMVEDVCKLDSALLAEANKKLNVPWAIVRYGRLCHEFYPAGQAETTMGEVYSTTKSLGATVVGMVSYQTRDIERTDRKTGQLSDWDRADHWLDTFTYNPEAHVAHVLAMVGHNPDLSWGKKPHAYDTTGTVQINTLSDMVNVAVAQDPTRLGANIEEFTQRFLYEPLGMTDSSWSTDAPDKIFAYSWSSTVRDMLRVGLFILHRGVWDGERRMSEAWAYKMTHPAFEDGNTAYGYLTWLSSQSNHSIGFSPPTAQGPSIPCAPSALWNEYPHGRLSQAMDCNYEPPASCTQEFDAGVWQAVGFMGMVIQGHPGLDMVLVVKNDALGGAGLWPAAMPAVIAKDPMFAGDEMGFCAAYSTNAYAPDLRPWSVFQ